MDRDRKDNTVACQHLELVANAVFGFNLLLHSVCGKGEGKCQQ